jgi:hypothetical protein
VRGATKCALHFVIYGRRYLSLLYNPNCANAKKSFTGWWEGTNTTRPLLQVIAPLNVPLENIPSPPAPKSLEDQWLNAGLRMDQFEYTASRTVYGCDAIPYFDPHLGSGHNGALRRFPSQLHRGNGLVRQDPRRHPHRSLACVRREQRSTGSGASRRQERQRNASRARLWWPSPT